MMLENLENWNPWWSSKEVPKALKGIQRAIDPLIFKTLHEKEITVLTGIRRCGKTTIMYQMISQLLKEVNPSQILYVNLDDEILKRKGLETIYNTYRQHKNPDKQVFIFFDEIQNIDQWEKFLKKQYDLKDKTKFIISGSSANLLKGEYSTLLTGRNFTFTITPLSFKEFLDFSEIDHKDWSITNKNKIINTLEKYLEYGGFPEVYFKEKELKYLLLKQYFDDIIYKDIVKRHNINPKKITDLAIYLLTNIANTFTIRKIRNFTGLSIDSIKDYISFLEDTFLVITLNHFSYSLKESSQLPKKGYTLDCGIRNITGFRFSSDSGRLAENCVCAALNQKKEIYYWKGKGEVDFIIKNRDNTLVAMNISYTDRLSSREIKGLTEFKKKFKRTKKLILITKDTEKEEKGITFTPLWKWLLK